MPPDYGTLRHISRDYRDLGPVPAGSSARHRCLTGRKAGRDWQAGGRSREGRPATTTGAKDGLLHRLDQRYDTSAETGQEDPIPRLAAQGRLAIIAVNADQVGAKELESKHVSRGQTS